MRLARSGAIALLGWCIIFPPVVEKSDVFYVKPNVTAPLNEWQAMKPVDGVPYPSQQKCEEARARMVAQAKDMLRSAPADVENLPSSIDTVKWTFALGAVSSRCIAQTDSEMN